MRVTQRKVECLTEAALEVEGYAKAAQWVYAQAVEQPPDRSAGERINLTELRQIHKLVVEPAWLHSPPDSLHDQLLSSREVAEALGEMGDSSSKTSERRFKKWSRCAATRRFSSPRPRASRLRRSTSSVELPASAEGTYQYERNDGAIVRGDASGEWTLDQEDEVDDIVFVASPRWLGYGRGRSPRCRLLPIHPE